MTLQVGFKSEFYKHIKGEKKNLFDIKTINISGVKNSFIAFQLFLENDTNFQLSLTNNPAFSIWPDQYTYRIEVVCEGIPSISIHKLGYIADDYGTLYTDMIENKEYFDVDKYDTVPLYVRIDIDRYAKAKKYKGSVNIYRRLIFQDETLLESCPFELTVKNIIMSDMKDTLLHLDLWQHLSNIARKHEVKLFSDEHFTVIEKYVKSLAAIGQKAVSVIASEIPWSGQRTFNDLDEPTDLFEYNYISVTKDTYGNFICDYSVLDKYISLCFSNGIKDEIEVFGLSGIWMDEKKGFHKVARDFPDGIRIRYYDQQDGIFKFMKSKAEIQGYIRLLYEYFIDKKILDKVRVIADEPDDINRYRQTIDAILEVAPKFKFKTAINHAEFTTEFDDVLSDLVPSLKCLQQDEEFFEKLAVSKEKRLSWYVCCRPHFPNTFIKSSLLESCFIGYLTSIMNFDGFLRWNYTVWPENPREKIAFRTDGWLAGDMNFVYPGHFGGPLLTIRYMALRRMVECYELLEKASFKNADIKKEVKEMLMKQTDLEEITRLGYDETLQKAPFTLDESDYQRIFNRICDILL
ncbi:MAG: DUF4091 domain-containing protein [Clostridia bacterium]|nr:DUF4091 domain-containing protein [Clostridia bacterium]